jgi:multimeric flavodoxin WrbA
LHDLEGGETQPFVDLSEQADGIVLGSPTINGDAVKPIWDLLSSLTVVDLRGKLGAAFGSYGWSGEAVPMIEDRLRGLKLRVPVPGLRVKLVPTEDELTESQAFGQRLAQALMQGDAGAGAGSDTGTSTSRGTDASTATDPPSTGGGAKRVLDFSEL